jgi:hypothetical protein
VPTVPFAAFLVGALLTMLLPIGLLIALSTWYWLFSAKLPKTSGGTESITDPVAGQPGPDVSAELPPDPAV